MIISSKHKTDREKILREIKKKNNENRKLFNWKKKQEEKYLGDNISENDCVASISETGRQGIKKL